MYNKIVNSIFFQKIYKDTIFSKPLGFLRQFFVYLMFKTRMIFEYINTIPRRCGIYSSRYNGLRNLRNKYRGKRCFIVCTGPSLTTDDLLLLKNEYVFGMNSLCLVHDRITWAPDFFGIQDDKVFEKVRDKLIETNNGLVFAPNTYLKKYNTPKDWIYFHISCAYHRYESQYGYNYFSRFSENCGITVYDGYSITYSIIQLAVYMGFDEIYLLGADCNYMGEKQHFIESGHFDDSANRAADRMIASYQQVKKLVTKKGTFKVFNATRGGCLELFPRVELEKVLLVNSKNKLAK